MFPSIRIGTSGWSYQHWREAFYPKDLKPVEWLSFYAQHFDTVEINASYYHLPKREVFENWAARTPAKFSFSVKASGVITHRKLLQDCEEELSTFLERCEGLGKKLGCVLFQFPPRWPRNAERLSGFLPLLPRGLRCAFEFRHQSWFCEETYALLRESGHALCIASSPGFPTALVTTAPLVYVRMHSGAKPRYTDEELATWAKQLRPFLSEGRELLIYFNNDVHGYALENARKLKELLAPPTRPRRKPPAKSKD